MLHHDETPKAFKLKVSCFYTFISLISGRRLAFVVFYCSVRKPGKLEEEKTKNNSYKKDAK